MTWLWKDKPERTPVEGAQDWERAERDLDWVVSRRPLITALAADLRQAREVNHFAERIRRAYGGAQ